MSRLRLLFLGPVQLMRDGQPVELSAAKAIALLAYLASKDQPQTREHVTDLLWPESLPDAARKNLRNTLWAVRKALGEGVLVQPDVDYLLLSDAVWVDVRAFEADLRVLSGTEAPDISQLQAAIGLYRAPLLEGLTLSEAPDFEICRTRAAGPALSASAQNADGGVPGGGPLVRRHLSCPAGSGPG